jgi:hypothetical protein
VRIIRRCVAATVTIIALLSVGASAAASPSSPARGKAAAPANINPDKHPVTDPAQISRAPSVSRPRSPVARPAWGRAAEDDYSHITCYSADGKPVGMAVVDMVDPTRPLTADQIMSICRMGYPRAHG